MISDCLHLDKVIAIGYTSIDQIVAGNSQYYNDNFMISLFLYVTNES